MFPDIKNLRYTKDADAILKALRVAGFETRQYGSEENPYWVLSMNIASLLNNQHLLNTGMLGFRRFGFSESAVEVSNSFLERNQSLSPHAESLHLTKRWQEHYIRQLKTPHLPHFMTVVEDSIFLQSFKLQVSYLSDSLNYYRSQVTEYGDCTVDNSFLLPFFVGQDSPEVCSKALRCHLSAASPVVTAVREKVISCAEFEEFAAIPEDWMVSSLLMVN